MAGDLFTVWVGGRLRVYLFVCGMSTSITSSVREMKVRERDHPSAPVDTDAQMGR